MANANRTFRSSMLLSTAMAALVAVPGVAHAQLVTAGDLDPVTGARDSGGNPVNLNITTNGAGTRTDMTVSAPVVIADWTRFNVPADTLLAIANGTVDPRATLVNRVTGPGLSDIGGTIDAPAINFWLINQNGILFGGGTSVNSASFFASTLDVEDQDLFDLYEGTDAFGNGSSALRFEGPSTAGILGGGPTASFVTDGSMMFVGQQLDLDATFDANSGRIAFVAASDVVVDFTPGSPLGFVLNAGTTVAEGITVGGAVSGRSIDFQMLTAAGVIDSVLRVDATLNATTAVPTENGVRLFATQAGIRNVTVEMDGGITSTGAVLMQTDGTLTATSSISGSSVNLVSGEDMTLDDVTATGGNVALASAGNLLAGNVEATDDIFIQASNSGFAQFESLSAGDEIATVGLLPSFIRVSGRTEGGSVDLVGLTGMELGDVVATTGQVRLNSFGGTLTVNDVDAATGVELLGTAINAADVIARSGSASLFASGAITTSSVTALAGSIEIVSTFGLDLDQGALDLGVLDASGTITLDTIGPITTGAITAGGALTVGGVRQPSSVTFNGPVSAADISINTLGAFAGGGLTATSGNIVILASGDVTLGDLRANAGAVSLSADGNLVTGNVNAGNAITLRANTGGDLDVGALASGSDITLDTAGAITTVGINAAGALTVGTGLTPTDVTFGGFVMARSIDVDASGAFQSGRLLATAGSIDIAAASIDTGQLGAVGGDLRLTSAGAITTGKTLAREEGGTGGAIAITSTGGSVLTLGDMGATGAIALDTAGDISTQAISAGGALTIGGTIAPLSVALNGIVSAGSIGITALGTLDGDRLTASAGGISIAAGSIDLGVLRATGGDVLLTSEGGIATTSISATRAGGVGGAILAQSNTGGLLTLGNLDADRDITLETTGAIAAGIVTAREGALTVGGTLIPATVTFGGNVRAQSVLVRTGGAFSGRNISATAGDITIDAATIQALALTATGAVDLDADGTIGTGTISAGGAIDVDSSMGGDLVLGNLTAGLGITLDTDGTIATGALTANGGPIAVGLGSAVQGVTFGGNARGESIAVRTGGAFIGAGLTATAGGIVLDAGTITAGALRATGGGVDLDADGDAQTGAITVTGGGLVAVAGGDLVTGAIAVSGGDVDLTAPGDVRTGAIGTSGAITAISTGMDGDLALGNLTAGLDITLDADGDIAAGALTASGGIIAVGLGADANSVTFGGNARGRDIAVTTAGLFTGTGLTATAGDVVIDAGSIAAGAFSATGGDVTLLAGGDIATGAITALEAAGLGGAILVESAAGALALGSLLADTGITLDAEGAIGTGAITVRSGDLEVGLNSSADSVAFGGNASARSIAVLASGAFTGANLSATAGSIAIDAGAITAGALSAIGGDVVLLADDDVRTGRIGATGLIDVDSTGGGDLVLGDLVAGLDITLDTDGNIAAGSLTASTGTVRVGLASSAGDVTFQGDALARSIDVLARGAFMGAGLTASAGSITIDAGSISAGDLSATGGNVDLDAVRDITTGAIASTGLIDVDSTGTGMTAGNLRLGALTAGLGITLDADGDIATGSISATGGALEVGLASSADNVAFGGNVSALRIDVLGSGEVLAGERNAQGALLRRTDITATAGDIVIAAGSITGGQLGATGDVALSALGDIDTTGIAAGGTIDVDSTGAGGDLRLGRLTAGLDIMLDADGDIATGQVDATRSLTVGTARSADSVTFGGTVTARDLRVLSTGAVLAGARDGTGALVQRNRITATGGDASIEGGSIAAGAIAATGGNLVLRAAGDIDTSGLTATRVGGVGGAIESRSTSGNLVHGAIVADLGIDLDAGGTATTGAITAREGAVMVDAAAITVNGGISATEGDVRLTAVRGISAGSITAIEADGTGGAIVVASTGTGTNAGAIGLGNLDAARFVTLTGNGAIATRAITASRGSVTASGDSIAVDGAILATGGDVRLTAERSIAAGAVTATRAGGNGGAIDIESTGTGESAGMLNLGALLADLGIELDARGAIATGALTARGGAIDIDGRSIAIDGATAATGGDVRLLAVDAITTDAIATDRAIDVDSTAGGGLDLGIMTAQRGITLDTTGTIVTGAITATNDLVIGGTREASAVTLGGSAQAANITVNAAGLVTAGAMTVGAGQVRITSADIELGGAVSAGNVLLTARNDGSIGLGTAAGTMSLTDAELDRITAANLTIDAGSGAVRIAGVSFRDAAGSSNVTIATTGSIAITGDLSGTGASRTFRLGGTSGGSGVASRITANIDLATIDLGTATLDLRGESIVFGQQQLIDRVFGTGTTPALSLDGQVKELIGNAGSELYTPANLSAARLANPTYLTAGRMRVTYGGSALFQNAALPGGSNAFDGVALGGAGAPAGAPLTLNPLRTPVVEGFNVTDGNVFALFGSIGGATGPAAALGGNTVISISDGTVILIPASRVNGCIIGSGEGCITTIVGNFVLNVPRQVVAPIVAEPGGALPFDPLVGTNNESLFSDAASAPRSDEECEQRDAAGNCVAN